MAPEGRVVHRVGVGLAASRQVAAGAGRLRPQRPGGLGLAAVRRLDAPDLGPRPAGPDGAELVAVGPHPGAVADGAGIRAGGAADGRRLAVGFLALLSMKNVRTPRAQSRSEERRV